MLRLEKVSKVYAAGTTTVKALDEVSVSFRKNEFVSILGPSGSGKTTLLNIIGGLDKYTNGDLIILGKSTKYFKDRDWDIYRNKRIGFVFQSYNLIPHQTVLGNVELALTITGVSRKDRKERALKALKEVGLEGQEHKKPNQLSGGQCQRVAIARALVNDPEILLADEPTGALDTKTSEQIMKLIQSVSKDKLVIMVTHNPDIADRYSTRILNLLDGKIVNDSKPFEAKDEIDEISHISDRVLNKKTKSKMSWGTAIGLSTRNLFSKFKRTLLVSIAGSIGIIGVSSVLAVSNGITNYIESMQDDMLSSYPLSIAEESVDYTSLMTGLSDSQKVESIQVEDGKIKVDSMINYLMTKYSDFTSVKTNDINHNLLDYIEDMPEDAYSAISYDYGVDVTNNIFTSWKKNNSDEEESIISVNGLTQMYIAELKTVDGFSEYAQFVDLFTDFMKQLPGDKEYIVGNGEDGQYDLLAGDFATEEDEIMLVVDDSKTLTDLVLAQLGFFSEEDFLNLAKKAIEENKENPDQSLIESYKYQESFSYDELIGKEFVYYPHDSLWSYEKVYETTYSEISINISRFVDMSSEIIFLAYNPTSDSLTGIRLLMGSNSKYESLSFTRDSSTPMVVGNESIGKWNGTYNDNDAVLEIVDNSTVIINGVEIVNGVNNQKVSVETTQKSYSANGFAYNAVDDGSYSNGMKMKIKGILTPNENTNFGCLSRGVYYTPKFTQKYLNDAKNSQILRDTEHGMYSYLGSEEEESLPFMAYVLFDYSSFENDQNNPVLTSGFASALNADLSTSISSLFSGFSGAVDYFEVDKIYLRSLSGQSIKQTPDIQTEGLLNKVITKNDTESYYQIDILPSKISIYPPNFESKDLATDYLDKWNSNNDIVLSDGTILKFEDRDDLTYTDTIEMIINVINTLIDIVTSALIAFTSLSLVVSCFMIAVITYISVVERVKEIGVIRSLGGRKRDVNNLFVAETFVIGFSSGLIGVGTTYLLCLVLNFILSFNQIPSIGVFNPIHALIMVALSFVLTVLSGLVPSSNASKQNPVDALRSE